MSASSTSEFSRTRDRTPLLTRCRRRRPPRRQRQQPLRRRRPRGSGLVRCLGGGLGRASSAATSTSGAATAWTASSTVSSAAGALGVHGLGLSGGLGLQLGGRIVQQAGLDALLGTHVATLTDAGPLADAVAQVVELGPAQQSSPRAAISYFSIWRARESSLRDARTVRPGQALLPARTASASGPASVSVATWVPRSASSPAC